MNKNVLNEISQMKFLFGYKPGKVLSEQEIPVEEDVMFADPDVMEPDVKPKTRPRPETPDTDPFPNPFDPDRAKEFNPLPDAEPQGRRRTHLKDLSGLRHTSKSEVDEPYIEDVEPTYELHLDSPDFESKSVDLEDLVSKYLSKKDEAIYEIHLNGDIDELF